MASVVRGDKGCGGVDEANIGAAVLASARHEKDEASGESSKGVDNARWRCAAGVEATSGWSGVMAGVQEAM